MHKSPGPIFACLLVLTVHQSHMVLKIRGQHLDFEVVETPSHSLAETRRPEMSPRIAAPFWGDFQPPRVRVASKKAGLFRTVRAVTKRLNLEAHTDESDASPRCASPAAQL